MYFKKTSDFTSRNVSRIPDSIIEQKFLGFRYPHSLTGGDVPKMENLDLAFPQIKDGKMARFCPSRGFILDLGGWGFAVPRL